MCPPTVQTDNLAPSLASACITFADFHTVHFVLQQNLHNLMVALDFMHQVCQKYYIIRMFVCEGKPPAG